MTDGTDGYQIIVGTYQDESDSQTTILTIPAAKNGADAAYTCLITSNEHAKSRDRITVNSYIFSKYAIYMFIVTTGLFKITFNSEPMAYNYNGA